MEKVSAIKFRQHLTDYLNQTKYNHERILVTRNGKVLGAFVPAEDVETLEALDLKKDIESFDKKMEQYEKGELKTVSHDEMMKRVGWDEV